VAFNRINGWLLVDGAALHHQMGLRGINASELAQASGLTEATLGRIRRGYVRVRPGTMAKLAKGLKKFPILDGVEPLLAAPQAGGNGHAVVGGTNDDQPPAPKPRRQLRPLRPDEGAPPEFVDGLPVIELIDSPKPSRKKAVATSP
jgi:transcriptional regulator with XRE-family HTH domain